MRTITLEEHYATEAFMEGPGRELKAQAEAARSHPQVAAGYTKLIEELCDLGDGRIAAMDAAGIDMQVLSLTSPSVEQLVKNDKGAYYPTNPTNPPNLTNSTNLTNPTNPAGERGSELVEDLEGTNPPLVHMNGDSGERVSEVSEVSGDTGASRRLSAEEAEEVKRLKAQGMKVSLAREAVLAKRGKGGGVA